MIPFVRADAMDFPKCEIKFVPVHL